MIDLINSIPDELRTVDAVFFGIRVVARFFGLTVWEDGSVG